MEKIEKDSIIAAMAIIVLVSTHVFGVTLELPISDSKLSETLADIQSDVIGEMSTQGNINPVDYVTSTRRTIGGRPRSTPTPTPDIPPVPIQTPAFVYEEPLPNPSTIAPTEGAEGERERLPKFLLPAILGMLVVMLIVGIYSFLKKRNEI